MGCLGGIWVVFGVILWDMGVWGDLGGDLGDMGGWGI